MHGHLKTAILVTAAYFAALFCIGFTYLFLTKHQSAEKKVDLVTTQFQTEVTK